MQLLRRYLASELDKMMKHSIRLLAVGALRRLPPAVREALRAAIAATRDNTGMTVDPRRELRRARGDHRARRGRSRAR